MGTVRLRTGNICNPYKTWQLAQSMKFEVESTLPITDSVVFGLTTTFESDPAPTESVSITNT